MTQATPAAPERLTCMFCGRPVANQGEAYYDHLRSDKACESAWRAWRENLVVDHPGGD